MSLRQLVIRLMRLVDNLLSDFRLVKNCTPNDIEMDDVPLVIHGQPFFLCSNMIR